MLEPGYPDSVVRVRVRQNIWLNITNRLCWFYKINFLAVTKLYPQNYFVTVTDIFV